MTPARCRKVAKLYAKLPPRTRIDMVDHCKCAAGIIGKAGDVYDEYDDGVAQIASILSGNKVTHDSYGFELGRVYCWLRSIGKLTAFYGLFSSTLGGYGRPNNDRFTTTSWMAKYWNTIADEIEKKGAKQ